MEDATFIMAGHTPRVHQAAVSYELTSDLDLDQGYSIIATRLHSSEAYINS